MSELKYDGPIVLVVLDGVGLRTDPKGNAVLAAHTDFLDNAILKYPCAPLKASGEAVGLTKGQMGNSEVGHNTIGAGQIVKQGNAKIDDDFATGAIWKTEAWRGAIDNIKNTGGALHFSGIFSDGGVHSDIKHLIKMVERASSEGIEKVYVHLVLDGRDVSPQSAEIYIRELERCFKNLKRPDYKIACGGGRMVFVADRYEADWDIVKKGYDAMVHGKAEYYFSSARDAMDYFRKEMPEVQDQYIPSFVICEPKEGAEPTPRNRLAPMAKVVLEPDVDKPVGLVKDGDSFIYFDFRADRAIEITQAFTYNEFDHFNRGTENNRRLDVFFAGLTEYNSDTHVPEHQLITPVKFEHTLHEVLGNAGITQLSIAETVKFGHITYYFNGNSYETFPNEEQINIPSDTRPFNERPWMKSAEIADALLDRLEQPNVPKFIRVNFAAGDMVGHFGDLRTTVVAMEAIDIELARIAKKIDELGGMMIITADHGNAEELLDENGEPKTAHSTNLVPCIFYDNTDNRKKYKLCNVASTTKTSSQGNIPVRISKESSLGLSNIAATITDLLRIEPHPSWEGSLIKVQKNIKL
ncbi:MAG: 2,3-bisphosphoglycerate-independent phosphoglycerate mutase [Candidatus Saccharibacteria bacterium]|nr:2,3-bisphosphoglycerate-independent phosphoglycerate mutase [Candidatus Saccharibacteria bacterium]